MKYLIVGLGNIGAEYEDTRHNIGFMALDALVKGADVSFKTERYGDVCKLKHRGRTLVLLKPSTYMNLSGKAVQYWMAKEQIPHERTLVVYDDLDLVLGALRIKSKGSGGSHNGINHIIEILGTINIPRLRIGIGKEFSRGRQVDFVLGKWSSEEIEVLQPRIKLAGEAILDFSVLGAERTMNAYNKK